MCGNKATHRRCSWFKSATFSPEQADALHPLQETLYLMHFFVLEHSFFFNSTIILTTPVVSFCIRVLIIPSQGLKSLFPGLNGDSVGEHESIRCEIVFRLLKTAIYALFPGSDLTEFRSQCFPGGMTGVGLRCPCSPSRLLLTTGPPNRKR